MELRKWPSTLADSFLYVSAENLGILTVRTVGGSAHIWPGDEIGLRFDENLIHVFDDNDARIRVH